jgi:aspartate-semialdehyde dehydrogenase
MMGTPGVAARTFAAVASQQASILLISQASSEQSICFVIPTSAAPGVIRAVQEEMSLELQRGAIDRVWAQDGVVIVTCVGTCMRETPGVAARICVALAQKGINIVAIAQGSSDCSVSIVVPDDCGAEAVIQIHREVILHGQDPGSGPGATGMVGQRFVQLLANHPWFQITALAASERSLGRCYSEACSWVIGGDPPQTVAHLTVQPLEPTLSAKLVFSALPAPVALEVEPRFAQAGYAVCSNAAAFRYAPDVPLVIPEVNADHLALIEEQRRQRGWKGFIVASPNCTTTGIAMVLKPLHDAFGSRKVMATTLQAISGAGYPGVASLDILDNVLPYIGGEEDKIEREPRLLLGSMAHGRRTEADFVVSAQANRVAVMDGHTICLSLGFERKPSMEQALTALRDFRGPEVVTHLPSAPAHPILVRDEIDRPQPRRDRDAEGGMAVTVGRARACPLLDLRLVLVVHNTRRGAAGGAIFAGELLKEAGWVG